MGSVSTIYNGVRTWLAGRALMDVALSDRSTNGVQNKVIKAKFDELSSDLSDLSKYSESSFQRSSGTITSNVLRRTGNSVNGIFGLTDNTVASYTSIAVVPEGYRPSHDKFGMGTFLINQVWTALPIKIASDGVVSCPFMSTTTIPAVIYFAVEYSLG